MVYKHNIYIYNIIYIYIYIYIYIIYIYIYLKQTGNALTPQITLLIKHELDRGFEAIFCCKYGLQNLKFHCPLYRFKIICNKIHVYIILV